MSLPPGRFEGNGDSLQPGQAKVCGCALEAVAELTDLSEVLSGDRLFEEALFFSILLEVDAQKFLEE